MFNLVTSQVDAKFLKFSVTNFESDKYISIRDQTAVIKYFNWKTGEEQLTNIEVSNNFKITRKPNKADAAIMNPSENIIALRAKNVAGTGQVLQVLKFSLNQKIFDMEKKNKLVNLDFPDPIVYWRWANADKLAVVTQNSVYHINIRNQPD